MNLEEAAETHHESDDSYPLQIREAQGDLADQANIEIDQEIQEAILKARQELAHPHTLEEDLL